MNGITQTMYDDSTLSFIKVKNGGTINNLAIDGMVQKYGNFLLTDTGSSIKNINISNSIFDSTIYFSKLRNNSTTNLNIVNSAITHTTNSLIALNHSGATINAKVSNCNYSGGTTLFKQAGSLQFNSISVSVDANVLNPQANDLVLNSNAGLTTGILVRDSTNTYWHNLFSSGGSGLTPPNSIKKYLNGYNNYATLNTDSIAEGTTNKYTQWLTVGDDVQRQIGSAKVTNTGYSVAGFQIESTSAGGYEQFAIVGGPTVSVDANKYMRILQYDDATMAIYSASANPFKITTGGSDRVNIDAVGSVGINNSSPHGSSIFDVASTTKGVLFPRLNTVQMNAVASPYAGLIITNTDSLNRLFIYTGSAWKGLAFTSETGGGSSSSQIGSVDTGWHRKGVVLNSTIAAEGNNTYEPSVIREGSAQILTSADTVFKMWYTSGWGSVTRKINYAESLDGINWTKYSGNPVVTTHSRSFVLKNGSTYYMYASNSASTAVDQYTSSNGVTWTLANANVINPGGGTLVYNSSVIIDGSTWRMLIDGYSGGTGYVQNYYTSTDGITWTAYGSNPVISGHGGGAPMLKKIGSTYYVWLGDTNGTATLPTDLYRYSSPDMINWTRTSKPTFPRRQADEGPHTSVGQVQDCYLLAVDSSVYIYYAASTDGLDSSARQQIKLAIAYMPFDQLVQNNEGDGAEVSPNDGTALINSLAFGVRGNILDSTVNFLGTTTSQPIIFKVNNLVVGKISAPQETLNFGSAQTYLTGAGTKNTNFGFLGMDNITTGIGNTSVGELASNAITTGNYNTTVGHRAGVSFSTGNYKTFIGYNSGALSTGSYQVAIGSNSLLSNSGDQNVSIGQGSMNGSGNGSYNTAVGTNALNGNTSGSTNIGIGMYAGYNNTTASNQIFIDNQFRNTYSDNQTQSPFYAQATTSMATQKVTLNGLIGINTITPTSTFQNTGSFASAYIAKAVDYTATISDNVIEVTVTGKTIILPTAVGITGREYTIKLTASGSGTVATTSSQTIDGSTTYSLASQYKYVKVQSNGTGWNVIGNN